MVVCGAYNCYNCYRSYCSYCFCLGDINRQLERNPCRMSRKVLTILLSVLQLDFMNQFYTIR